MRILRNNSRRRKVECIFLKFSRLSVALALRRVPVAKKRISGLDMLRDTPYARAAVLAPIMHMLGFLWDFDARPQGFHLGVRSKY